ncbi:MAG: hypothetical protein KDK36_16400 [Leptospiraceae bacterium]|nr:hypothetical protein [Leptospiraceae bacterium]
MEELIFKTKQELNEDLRIFLEAYHKTKILEAKDDSLKMYILLAKNKNKTPKEKLINFKLLRVDERLFPEDGNMPPKDAIICEFLIDELKKYVAKTIKNRIT